MSRVPAPRAAGEAPAELAATPPRHAKGRSDGDPGKVLALPYLRLPEAAPSFPVSLPSDTLPDMNQPNQPNVKFVQTSDYREAYANSVQIRVNVWDFFLVFGTMQQASETQVELRNFQGIYLSPQQAKALMALLQQNVSNYEVAFGEIKLDPRAPGGPIH